jgi:hypothetical protein
LSTQGPVSHNEQMRMRERILHASERVEQCLKVTRAVQAADCCNDAVIC